MNCEIITYRVEWLIAARYSATGEAYWEPVNGAKGKSKEDALKIFKECRKRFSVGEIRLIQITHKTIDIGEIL